MLLTNVAWKDQFAMQRIQDLEPVSPLHAGPSQDGVAPPGYDLCFCVYLTQLIKVPLSLGTLEALLHNKT